jgi:LacI family transcriptional regulator
MAGVSQTTVSRVLSGASSVSTETRARVLAAIEQVNYAPNHSARAMRTRRSGTVGIVVARLTNPFYPELLEALNRALSAQGLRMILWDAELLGEEPAVDAIRAGLVDGIMFTTVVRDSPAVRAAFDGGAPIVIVNRPAPDLPCDQVASANGAGGRRIAKYLFHNGRRRFGVLVGPGDVDTSTEREDGFRAGLSELGVAPDDVVRIEGDFTHASGYAGLVELMSRPEPPDAVFCVNDLIALGALDAARVLGVAVPGQLWVAGYDNIEMASWAAYDLTTAEQPKQAMADAAVELLRARMADPTRALEMRRFPPVLQVRGSTAGRAESGAPAVA